MQYQASYSTKEKLTSLSERLKYLTNTKTHFVDTQVKSENLKLNLTLIISHIILNLRFIDRSKDAFLKVIDTYNKAHQTCLVFQDFEACHWVWLVEGEVVLPEVIRRFIWTVGHYEKDGKTVDIPIGKNDLTRCLQSYYQSCFEDAKLTITQRELEEILANYASKEVTINFLVERNILEFDALNDLYSWKENDYTRHSSNEIASTLWLLIGGEDATLLEFNQYFKRIKGTQIRIDKLQDYLSPKNTSKICDLAVDFLEAENDLLKSDDEFHKLWLDAVGYAHVDIMAEIPVVVFNYATPFDFISSVNYHEWRFRGIFDYQCTRSFCHTLLRLIVDNNPHYPTPYPYEQVLTIMSDTSRPFLMWTLYNDIKRNFPKVIPYLLTDWSLVPMAFMLIDGIEINPSFLLEQSDNDKKTEEKYAIKNQIWLEMFDLILDEFDTNSSIDDVVGDVLAKILLEVATKMFGTNSSNSERIIQHNSLKKRYIEALNKLSSKRILETNNPYRPQVSPRLVFSVLPSIVEYFKEKKARPDLNHTEYLSLNAGFVDLCIETLRFTQLPIAETEVSDTFKEQLKGAASDLTTLLKDMLIEFYTITDIKVQVYNATGVETRQVKRGIGVFGFEIIDWGYLYLHFEKHGMLKTLNEAFTNALKFNCHTDKYDEQNKEQFEKIKRYLQSLMMAFIAIHQNKDAYEIEGLPVKAALDRLEKTLTDLSLTHSIDDLSAVRIDVFTEGSNIFNYDMYHQSLTTLLYKSINYFSRVHQDIFVKNFFDKSIDIGRMLTAINLLDAKKLTDIISQQIASIEIEDFIQSRFTTTELKYALIEAINSENHWVLAKPLIDKIQAHYERIKHHDENTDNLLFEINLLLAFKEKNFDTLTKLQVPVVPHAFSRINKKAEATKTFFIALFHLYNDKEYEKAIQLLNYLLLYPTIFLSN